MKGRPNEMNEPRDLGREWHSDSKSHGESNSDCSIKLIANPQVCSRIVHPTFRFFECKTRHRLVATRCGARAMSCIQHQLKPKFRNWLTSSARYDRMSPSFRSYLETLTATCAQPVFKTACDAGGYEVMSPRGSPFNKDFEFAPVHPVVSGRLPPLLNIACLQL